jgi:hypothetical protein
VYKIFNYALILNFILLTIKSNTLNKKKITFKILFSTRVLSALSFRINKYSFHLFFIFFFCACRLNFIAIHKRKRRHLALCCKSSQEGQGNLPAYGVLPFRTSLRAGQFPKPSCCGLSAPVHGRR